MDPINVGGYVNANRLQVQMAYRCATVLRGVIEQYILRRLKTTVADELPEKTEEVLFCRLTELQRQKYNDFLSSDEVDDVMQGHRRSFRAIGILRKICNHPDLLEYHAPKRKVGYGGVEKSGKMKVLHHILPQWKKQGHKALIFSQTQQMLDILEQYVQTSGYSYLRMDGNTPVRQRACPFLPTKKILVVVFVERERARAYTLDSFFSSFFFFFFLLLFSFFFSSAVFASPRSKFSGSF